MHIIYIHYIYNVYIYMCVCVCAYVCTHNYIHIYILYTYITYIISNIYKLSCSNQTPSAPKLKTSPGGDPSRDRS